MLAIWGKSSYFLAKSGTLSSYKLLWRVGSPDSHLTPFESLVRIAADVFLLPSASIDSFVERLSPVVTAILFLFVSSVVENAKRLPATTTILVLGLNCNAYLKPRNAQCAQSNQRCWSNRRTETVNDLLGGLGAPKIGT